VNQPFVASVADKAKDPNSLVLMFSKKDGPLWLNVAADGSLSKKRQFAKLDLTPAVLEAPKPEDRLDSGADGSAVDTDGRYYVATRTGVQIFMPDGTYAGTIWLPQYPVSITFGGANNDD
jgi:gluconolactonase